jgi:phospholipid-translocating ATPase
LAIGDGANDQPMIIEADCGVGISGREGTQCARAADISFTKFRHLARLLLVHGRNSYRRSAFVAQFFFYKSVLLCIQQLAFALFSSFSGTSLFETFALMSFNTFFSSFQPLCFVFDRDLSDRTLLLRPQLYAESQRGALFTWSSLLSWLARSTLQGIIVFIIVFSTENSDPFSLGIREQASTTFTILILLLSASMLLESTTITSWSAIVMIGTWVFYLLAATSASFIGPASPEYGLFVALASRPQYWLRVLVATVAAMVPVYATKWYFQLFHPTLSQSIQFNAPNA